MIEALGKRVLVQPLKTSTDVTKSGLYIPSTSDQSAIVVGTVLSAGDDALGAVGARLVGSRAWFNKFTAAKVTDDVFSCTVDELFAVEYPEQA